MVERHKKKKLHEWVYAKRKKLGMSRRELADLSGVSIQTIHRLERKAKPVKIETAQSLINALENAKPKKVELPAGVCL